MQYSSNIATLPSHPPLPNCLTVNFLLLPDSMKSVLYVLLNSLEISALKLNKLK